MANGFPVSALAGRREVMRLGGFADDADRVFLLSQTAGAQPWALAAMLAVIDTYEREGIADQLHGIGAELRAGVEEVVAGAGLSDYFQLRGRDCNLVYVARDGEGQPSQEFRTLVLQEFLERGILAPSFVVNAAHDPKAIQPDRRCRGRADAGLPASARRRRCHGAARPAGQAGHQAARIGAGRPRDAVPGRPALAASLQDERLEQRSPLVGDLIGHVAQRQ